MYTKARQLLLDKYPIPEILRTRLEDLCLLIKILELGKIKKFLSLVPESPPEKSVDISIDVSQKM